MNNDRSAISGRIHRAALRGDEQTLEQCLQTTQPNAATNILGNILHISAMLGHVRFTEVLLNHNGDLVSRADSSGITALHLASAEGNLQIVQRILLFNNDNNELCLVRDEEGRIPLHYAAIRGRTEVVQELIKAKPESLSSLHNGKTVFHLCVTYDHLETLETLVKLDYATANIGREPPYSRIFALPDSTGNTILHLAIMFKRFEAVKYLLSIPEIRELEKEKKNAEGLTAHDILELSPEDEKINEIKLIWTKDDDVENPETWILKCIGNCFIKIFKWILKKLKNGSSTNWLEEMRGNLTAASIFIATITFQALINPPGGFIQQGSSSSSSQDNTTSSSSSSPLDCTDFNDSQN